MGMNLESQCICGHHIVKHLLVENDFTSCNVRRCPCLSFSSRAKNEGRKDDQAKERYDLIPPKALHEVVKVLTFGANKYGDDNWRKVPGLKARYTAAALRHVWAWVRSRGQELDADTGLSHLAHAGCCILFLLEAERE